MLETSMTHMTLTIKNFVDPTGKTISADYVYSMHFEEGLIRHLTKIWNHTISLKQLGLL